MKRESPEEQRKQMLEAPIPGLIGRLAVPTIISMLITNIYNMADTFFVSQIGTSASGAVGAYHEEHAHQRNKENNAAADEIHGRTVELR